MNGSPAPSTAIPAVPPAADEDQAALRFAASREAALCTILGIDGSFSRRLGAQLAVASDGRGCAGSLADGCLERELAQQAALVREARRPVLLRYGQGSPFIDFRLPCGSGLDILVDPAPDRAALSGVVEALDRRRPASLVLPAAAAHLLRERAYQPPLRLLLLGAGPEVGELARLATAFGAVHQAAGPGAGLAIGRTPDLEVDPWTAVLLLFHDHDWEREVLAWALGTPAFYLGAIGGEVAREARRSFLLAQGHDPSAVARIRSPIGLVPKARDARVLALSILAEVVAAYEGLRACAR